MAAHYFPYPKSWMPNPMLSIARRGNASGRHATWHYPARRPARSALDHPHRPQHHRIGRPRPHAAGLRHVGVSEHTRRAGPSGRNISPCRQPACCTHRICHAHARFRATPDPLTPHQSLGVGNRQHAAATGIAGTVCLLPARHPGQPLAADPSGIRTGLRRCWVAACPCRKIWPCCKSSAPICRPKPAAD